ncbi:MAG: DUF4910 domain-containing protein, partial [Candidatus Heimdallarchaeaceae archaeon]
MNLEELVNTIAKELSGERAKRFTRAISSYHRIQASSGLLSALQLIKAELDKIGDKNNTIMEYIADGKANYFGWSSPIPWEIEDGFLKLIEPEEKFLCRYDEVPESIVTHSKSVDIQGEVVDVGEGKKKDFEGQDVKGKIVLTTASPRAMIERLHEFGAIGMIGYPTEQRAAGHDDLIQYLGIWPNADNIDKSSFGFSLSRRQALELQNYLKKGKKMIVHAKIDAKLEPGNMHILTTKIDGTTKPEEEIVLIAHVCHPYPSANDNASGSALLLEVFRTIFMLIKEEKITRPERTIRFLWVPEFSGTLPWIKEQTEKSQWKPQFCLNLDMVGEHPAIVGEPFTVNQSSVTTPSYLNDLITKIIDKVKDNRDAIEQSGWQHPWNYRIKPYAGGSDHILFADEPVRIPAVMFGHGDRFWHTSLDTIEKVDSTELKRVGIVTVATVLASSYSRGYSNEILKSFISGHLSRRGQFLDMFTNGLTKHCEKEEEKDYGTYCHILQQLIHTFISNEQEILKTVTHSFVDYDENLLSLINKEFNEFLYSLKAIANKISFPSLEGEIKKELMRIPKRKWDGPFDSKHIYSVLSEDNKKQIDLKKEQIERIMVLIQASSFGGAVLEFINLIDGKRSLLEILSN